jgi:hypothetical protein
MNRTAAVNFKNTDMDVSQFPAQRSSHYSANPAKEKPSDGLSVRQPSRHAVTGIDITGFASADKLWRPALREHSASRRFKSFKARFRYLFPPIDRKVISQPVHDECKPSSSQRDPFI